MLEKQGFFDIIKSMNTEKIIQDILDEMSKMFHDAVGPRSRREYMKKNDIRDSDWHFQLNVEQIIKNKIPANVMGCTGRAKLFCELAKRKGINASVVCTAKYKDWKDVKNGKSDRIRNGHQINAVKIDGVWRVFDAGYEKLKFIKTDLTPGSFLTDEDIVTAVVPGDKFQKVDRYRKLHNLYVSGDMNNSEFTIKPKLFQRGTKLVRNKIMRPLRLLAKKGERQ